MAHCLYVFASCSLTLAFVACGISFFGPYWLQNVMRPALNPDGSTSSIESNTSYIYYPQPSRFIFRGLWAQCSGECQWFWENNYRLQYQKFSALRWHLATQILYFVGAFLVLFCEIYARVQLCCDPHKSVFRSIGFILLSSFVIQAAAVAVWGGFANRDYGAVSYANMPYTYLGWCFWMAVAGGGWTLLAGMLFLFMDCCAFTDDK